jgi:hypothetical protein
VGACDGNAPQTGRSSSPAEADGAAGAADPTGPDASVALPDAADVAAPSDGMVGTSGMEDAAVDDTRCDFESLTRTRRTIRLASASDATRCLQLQAGGPAVGPCARSPLQLTLDADTCDWTVRTIEVAGDDGAYLPGLSCLGLRPIEGVQALQLEPCATAEGAILWSLERDQDAGVRVRSRDGAQCLSLGPAGVGLADCRAADSLLVPQGLPMYEPAGDTSASRVDIGSAPYWQTAGSPIEPGLASAAMGYQLDPVAARLEQTRADGALEYTLTSVRDTELLMQMVYATPHAHAGFTVIQDGLEVAKIAYPQTGSWKMLKRGPSFAFRVFQGRETVLRLVPFPNAPISIDRLMASAPLPASPHMGAVKVADAGKTTVHSYEIVDAYRVQPLDALDQGEGEWWWWAPWSHGYVEHAIDVPADGDYTLTVDFQSSAGATVPIGKHVAIDRDISGFQLVTVPSGTTDTFEVTFPLTKGVHRVAFQHPNQELGELSAARVATGKFTVEKR